MLIVQAASVASVLVSPLVSIVDKAMVKELTGFKPFVASLHEATMKMFTDPRAFITGLPFRLTCAVYLGTYTAANLSHVYSDLKGVENLQERRTMKVACATLANVSLLAWRDSVFARHFSSGPKRAVPWLTVGLFCVRDSATMAATFYGEHF